MDDNGNIGQQYRRPYLLYINHSHVVVAVVLILEQRCGNAPFRGSSHCRVRHVVFRSLDEEFAPSIVVKHGLIRVLDLSISPSLTQLPVHRLQLF